MTKKIKFKTMQDYADEQEKLINKILPKVKLKMPKKPIHYMMLSGWLPIPYSQWNYLQSLWVGSCSLNTDQFYNACKIIADRLNDKKKKSSIKKTIISYLKKDPESIRDIKFFESFFDYVFQMVQESYEIQQFIIKNYI